MKAILVVAILAVGVSANSLVKKTSILASDCVEFSGTEDEYTDSTRHDLKELSVPGVFTIDGFVSDLTVTGLKSLNLKSGFDEPDDGNGNSRSAQLLQAGKLGIVMTYDVTGTALTHPFSGKGQVKFNVENFIVKSRAAITMKDKKPTEITNLVLNIDFDKMEIHMDAFMVDGQEVNWDEINQQLKANFDELWKKKEDEIVETIRTALNEYLKGPTLQRLTARFLQDPSKCSFDDLFNEIGNGGGGGGGTTPSQDSSTAGAYSSVAYSSLVLFGILFALTNFC